MAVLPQIATSTMSAVAAPMDKHRSWASALIAVLAAWRKSAAPAGPWMA